MVAGERWYKLDAHSVSTDFIVADCEEKQMATFKEDIETYNHDIHLGASPRWLIQPES